MRRNFGKAKILKIFTMAILSLSFPLVYACGCTKSSNGGGEEDADVQRDTTEIDSIDAIDAEQDTIEDEAEDILTDDTTTQEGTGMCRTNVDCSNGIFCDGEEQCIDGVCYPADKPACDDGIDCTIEHCDEEAKKCRYEINDEMCDDGLFCTGEEYCSVLHGCMNGPTPDCSDDDICTIDLCVEEEGGCVHRPRDLDEDGHIDKNCGGDDCNDSDPEINPDMEEICDDGKDNNCNMQIDMSDEACRPENDTCAHPVVLTEAVAETGTTEGTLNNYTSNICFIWSESDVVYQINLAQERDLIVNVISSTAGTVYASLQTACGVASSELKCDSGSNVTVRKNHLPAGTYYIIVWSSTPGQFTISYTTEEPTPRPANDTCDGAIDVSSGGTFSGTTVDCLSDYTPSCSSGSAPDTFYYFTITEPKKITIDVSATGWVNVGVALMTSCGDVSTEIECSSDPSSSATIQRNFLGAGTYYIAVDINDETSYTLTVQFEEPIYPPPNDRCDGGIDISGGGLFVGSLMESYRDYPISCSQPSFIDVTYTFTTTELQDVSLILSPIGASADMAIGVVTDCSDLSTEIRCRIGNPAGFTLRSLSAGTYYVIVSGTLHGSGSIRGRYLLEVEFGPPTPVPPNDSCTGPEDISAGGTFIGTTVGTFDDYDTICGPSNYYDVIYTFTISSPSDAIIEVTPDTPGEVALEIESVCGNPSTMEKCRSSTSGQLHARSLPAGTHYLIVDMQYETDFNMNVTFGPPTTICDGAEVIDVDLAGGSFAHTISGTTTGEDNDFEATCAGSARSPDVPYRLNIPERAVVTAEITYATYDTALHIRTVCEDPSTELYCDDDGGSGLWSRISATLDSGTYFLIVDGYSSSNSGNYTLQIEASPSP